jgi:hypothetical protein
MRFRASTPPAKPTERALAAMRSSLAFSRASGSVVLTE